MELTVRTMTPPTVSLERLKKHASSHRSVYDTLRNRDLAGARRAMEEHMLEVENRYADKARHEDGGEGQA